MDAGVKRNIFALSFIGTAPLGSLEVGFIGDHAGPRVAVVICSMVSLACGFFLLTKLKMFAMAQAAHEKQSAADLQAEASMQADIEAID